MTGTTTVDIRDTLGTIITVLAGEEVEDATVDAHEYLLEISRDESWDTGLSMPDVQRVGRAVMRQDVIGHLTDALKALEVLNAPLTSSSILHSLSPHTCPTSHASLKAALERQEQAAAGELMRRQAIKQCVFWLARDAVDAVGRPLLNKHERCGICEACR